jgi:hypothetical protein
MRVVTLYRLSGLAVLIGMAIMGIASVFYSRAGGVALYLDPAVPADDLAKLFGSLIFLIGLPGLYAFQAGAARGLGLAGFVLSFLGLAILEVGTEALFAFTGPVLAAHHQTRFLLLGGLDQNLGGGFAAYFALSYVLTVAGFLSFGIATFRARIYPRWAGLVIATGSIAAIMLMPLASVPSGPFRLDRIGVLATAFAFAWCGWHLLRHAAASLEPESNSQLPTVSAVERVDASAPPVSGASLQHRRQDARDGKVPAAQIPEEFPDPTGSAASSTGPSKISR